MTVTGSSSMSSHDADEAAGAPRTFLSRVLIASPLRSDGQPPDQPVFLSRRASHLRWIAFLAGLGVGVGLMLTVSMVAPGGSDLWMMLGELLGSVLGYAGLLAAERRLAQPYELQSGRGLPALLIGLGIGTVLLLVCVGILTVTGLRVFTGLHHPTHVWTDVLQVGIVAAVSEEIIFRGVMYRIIERGLGTWWAIGISGIVFGLAHLTNPEGTILGALAIAVEAGLMFAVVYAISRNLPLLIGIHAAWNLVQGPVLGIVVSGTSSEGNGLFSSHPAGPELLSGGGFGIEASLITVAVLSIVTVLGLRWLVRHDRIVAR